MSNVFGLVDIYILYEKSKNTYICRIIFRQKSNLFFAMERCTLIRGYDCYGRERYHGKSESIKL